MLMKYMFLNSVLIRNSFLKGQETGIIKHGMSYKVTKIVISYEYKKVSMTLIYITTILLLVYNFQMCFP